MVVCVLLGERARRKQRGASKRKQKKSLRHSLRHFDPTETQILPYFFLPPIQKKLNYALQITRYSIKLTLGLRSDTRKAQGP